MKRKGLKNKLRELFPSIGGSNEEFSWEQHADQIDEFIIQQSVQLDQTPHDLSVWIVMKNENGPHVLIKNKTQVFRRGSVEKLIRTLDIPTWYAPVVENRIHRIIQRYLKRKAKEWSVRIDQIKMVLRYQSPPIFQKISNEKGGEGWQ